MPKCKICESDTTEIVHQKFKLTFYYCSNCEFIFKDDKHTVSKEDELKTYNNHHNSIEDIRYVNYFKDFIDSSIIPFIKSGSVLDFGSGPSPVLAQILERDYKFDVDIYDYFYQPKKIYENKRYDLITTTEVVEHLNDPLKYFKLFKKHLKQKGYLSVMTQFHPNDNEKFLDWHYIRDMTHRSFYTLKTFKQIALQLNMQIEYTNNEKYITLKKN